MREILNKSTNFWKNDLTFPKVARPCCCPSETTDTEHNSKISQISMEQLPLFQNKHLDIFKTIKRSEVLKYKEDIILLNKNNINLETKEKKKYNDWEPNEDILLLRLCNSNLHNKWKKISLMIGKKTPRMCAYRIKKLQKHLNILKKRGKEHIFEKYQNSFKDIHDGEIKRLNIKKLQNKNERRSNYISTLAKFDKLKINNYELFSRERKHRLFIKNCKNNFKYIRL